MRWTTITCVSAALFALAVVTACSGADDSNNGSTFAEGASTGSDSGPSSSSSPPNANGSSSSTSDAGGTTTPPPVMTDAAPPPVDSAAPFNPATCECYPGQTRWCDPGDGQDLGKEQCTASGTWGACTVTNDAPPNCPTATLLGRGAGANGDNVDIGTILALCCASSGAMCCEDMQDTDDSDGGTAYPGAYPYSYGKCDSIACPNTIKTGSDPTGLKGP